MAKGVKYQVIVFVGLAMVGILVFPLLISMLFPKFSGAMPLYVLMLFGLIPNSFSGILTIAFYALRAQKSLFYAVVVKSASIALIAPITLSFFGVPGIALEFFITTTIFTLERFRALRKLLPGLGFSVRSFVSVDQDDRVIIEKIGGPLKYILASARSWRGGSDGRRAERIDA
jgi:O-antigen/teichoic acid export membrane protein